MLPAGEPPITPGIPPDIGGWIFAALGDERLDLPSFQSEPFPVVISISHVTHLPSDSRKISSACIASTKNTRSAGSIRPFGYMYCCRRASAKALRASA